MKEARFRPAEAWTRQVLSIGMCRPRKRQMESVRVAGRSQSIGDSPDDAARASSARAPGRASNLQ